MSLVQLPYELLSYVVNGLDLADIRSLSLVCRKFQFLVRESRIAKLILETKAPHSKEATRARITGHHTTELRRLVKRREAVSSVSPYLVTIVAVAETWLYVNGILSYTNGRELRILNLHGSGTTELIVDIRSLLDKAIPDSVSCRKYRFQLLHTAGDIISCLYTHARPEQFSWLVVFNARQQRVLTAPLLDSAHKIFVRNDDRFLYYGTHSEFGRDGFRHWVLKGFDLQKGKWFEKRQHLSDFVGSDIGSTICFEIYDGFLYGLSNLTTFEVDEVDWTSYYYCFRFPVGDPESMEVAPKTKMWRREHAEGPIDDRWTFLRVVKDEALGTLKIIESRKEWLAGSSSARRSYYVKDLVFQGSNRENSPECLDSGSPSLGKAGRHIHNPVTGRDSRTTYSGDDGSDTLMFTLSKSHIRAFFPECQTFMDLVDDPSESDPSNGQRLRLRGSSSRLHPYDEPQFESKHQTTSCEPNRAISASGSLRAVANTREHTSKHEDVMFWPPEPDPSNIDAVLDELYSILNPPDQSGNVMGAWDERSLVYGTGGTAGGPQALVFVSFDPAILLPGIRPCPQVFPSQAPSRLHNGAAWDGCNPRLPDSPKDGAEGKGKRKEVFGVAPTHHLRRVAVQSGIAQDQSNMSIPRPSPNETRESSSNEPRCRLWSVEQTPMYERIVPKFSYYFGL